MEDQIKEALNNAGMTEEELTANGEAAKKAMEAKAEAAASKVEENKNPEVQEDGKETDMNTNEKKWDAKRIIKWTAITLGCVAVGIGAALLLKNREAVAAAAEATTEATE
jgi:hypothetical protein